MKAVSYILLLLACAGAQAQTSSLTGIVADKTTRQPVVNANLTMTRLYGARNQYHASTGPTGAYGFSGLIQDAYTIKVTCVGYQDAEKRISVRAAAMKLDTIFMTQKPVELNPVEVVDVLPPVELKKDTVQFNAGAFKTNPDATAEDLMKKMPGITIDNSTIKAQGENVQQVLLDGRQFFGDDPFIAMRNIPADVIEKVQVYDKMSDQAELTGFDDGQAVKTINIITRPNRRDGQFGKLYAGAGEDSRYQAGGSTNFFSGTRRVSLIGLSNNVNQQNFSAQDLLGVMGNAQRSRGGMGGMRPVGGGGGGRGFQGRGGDGGFGGGMGFDAGGGGGAMMNNYFIGSQNGINTTHSLGVNFSDVWAEKLSVTGSYFGNFGANSNDQSLSRTYITTAADGQAYSESDRIDSKNQNHRLTLRVEYTIDSSNALIFNPRMSFQNNRSETRVAGLTSFAESGLFSRLATDNASHSDGNNFSGSLAYRHRFAERGRTLSVGLTSASNAKHTDGTMRSLFDYADPSAIDDTLDQQTLTTVPGYSVSSNIAYTEPVFENAMMQANYTVSYTHNTTDKRLYAADPVTGRYSALDTALSNTLENNYVTQRYGIGLMQRGADYNLNIQLGMQHAKLDADYTFPSTRSTGRMFTNFVPMAMLQYRMSPTSNLRFIYRSSTAPPSVSQLQSTVDNSNPALPVAGNPDLKQSYTHSFTARYSYGGFQRSNSFFALVSAGFTNDYIGNATFLFPRDTVFFGSTLLSRGTQLTQPVNFNGYQTLNSFFTYGLPIDYIRSSVNVSTGIAYTRVPGMVNSQENITRNIGLTQGAVLASNISEDVDFTLAYNVSFNRAMTSAPPQTSTKYWQHTGSLKSSVIVWNGIVLRNDMSYYASTASTAGYDQHYLMWNLGIAKKFFEDKSLEAALNVYDVMNRNSKVTRSVTETYIED
ncbi:MAG: outer membrane beta-barrel protein, partial [Acidobacteriota bacterium]